MDIIEIFDRNNANSVVTLNAKFYPIPPTDSMIYFEEKCYIVKKIIYDIDEHKVRIMVTRC